MKKIAAVLVILVIGIGIYWSRSGNDKAAAQEVFTAKINRGDITRSVATTGAVEPLVNVEVGSQLSGQIAKLYVDFNSPVKKDQVIALIDPQTFEKRVRQAEADKKVAEANVVVQKATITRAEANLHVAKLDYERQKALVKKGTLAQTSLDTALANYQSAQADLEIAKAQLVNAKAMVEQKVAALSSAQIDLERTQIRSPINGVVISRKVDVGQTVAASLSSPVLFNIAQDLREIQLQASVDESDIGNIKVGNPVTFSVDAYPNDKFRGKVEQIRLAPDEEQNVVTYTVIISARNPNRKLLPGMTANIEIVTGERKNVLRVANDALRFRPKNAEAIAGQSDSMLAGGGRPGNGPGGGGPNQMLMMRLEPLHLDEAKKQQIQKAISESFADMRKKMFGQSSGGLFGGMPRRPPGSFNRSEMQQRIQNMIDRVLQQYLTPDQMEQFQEASNDQQDIRRGEIWVQEKDGKLQRQPVLLGISDDEYTELLNSNLEPGTVVVTRIREKKI